MDNKKNEIVQEIIKLKTTKENSLDNKSKIQRLQQELDKIEYEKKNTKNL